MFSELTTWHLSTCFQFWDRASYWDPRLDFHSLSSCLSFLRLGLQVNVPYLSLSSWLPSVLCSFKCVLSFQYICFNSDVSSLSWFHEAIFCYSGFLDLWAQDSVEMSTALCTGRAGWQEVSIWGHCWSDSSIDRGQAESLDLEGLFRVIFLCGSCSEKGCTSDLHPTGEISFGTAIYSHAKVCGCTWEHLQVGALSPPVFVTSQHGPCFW